MYWEYTLMEYLGFITALCSLPLLGFLAGRQHPITRLNSERDRAEEVRSLHDLINQNADDVADQVRSIYQEIGQLQDNNPRTTT